MPEACLHARECEIFGLLLVRVVQKAYDKTGPFSHILYSFSRAIHRYIDRAARSRRNKMFCAGVSINSRVTMLTKAARTPPNLA